MTTHHLISTCHEDVYYALESGSDEDSVCECALGPHNVNFLFNIVLKKLLDIILRSWSNKWIYFSKLLNYFISKIKYIIERVKEIWENNLCVVILYYNLITKYHI